MFGAYLSNIAHFGQRLDIRFHERVEITKVVSQIQRRVLSHLANAQGVKKSRQRRLSALLDRIKQILRREFREARQLGKLFQGELIDARRRVDQAFFEQLINSLAAKAFDVEREARREVNDGLASLRGTGEAIEAAKNRFIFGAVNGPATLGAGLGRFDLPRIIRPRLGLHAHYLRDHITRAKQPDGITDAQIKPLDLVEVVQGDVADRDTSHMHGFDARYRSDRSGSTDGKGDLVDLRDGFLRGELPGDRPARPAQHVA